ncbi:hypothetical protein LINPERHAP1_LOCUS32896 [Linum perenne]
MELVRKESHFTTGSLMSSLKTKSIRM